VGYPEFLHAFKHSPSFGPAGELVAWRVPKGATITWWVSKSATFVWSKSNQNHLRPIATLSGAFVSAPNSMAAQLASLKQCSPKKLIRRRGLAAPKATSFHRTRTYDQTVF